MDLVKYFKDRKFQSRYYKDIKKIDGEFILELDQKAYTHYIEHTKNRENTSYDLARKVLTRNVLLSEVDENYTCCKIFYYGNLWINVSIDNKITYVRNCYNHLANFKVDKEYKNWLNVKLGIS